MAMKLTKGNLTD